VGSSGRVGAVGTREAADDTPGVGTDGVVGLANPSRAIGDACGAVGTEESTSSFGKRWSVIGSLSSRRHVTSRRSRSRNHERAHGYSWK
jgi:hypothetical protein